MSYASSYGTPGGLQSHFCPLSARHPSPVSNQGETAEKARMRDIVQSGPIFFKSVKVMEDT